MNRKIIANMLLLYIAWLCSPTLVNADIINGRWVEIPHCAVAPGFDCNGNPGWPWVEAIHLTLTHHGKLLLWKDTLNRLTLTAWRKPHYWDPNTTVDVELNPTDVQQGKKNAFCGGHLALSDGRILIVGGQDETFLPMSDRPAGHNTVWIFDPESSSPQLVEQVSTPMSFNRWYPTPTILPDGRIIVIGGAEHRIPQPPPVEAKWNIAENPEIYDPIRSSPGWDAPLNAPRTDVHLYTFIQLRAGAWLQRHFDRTGYDRG